MISSLPKITQHESDFILKSTVNEKKAFKSPHSYQQHNNSDYANVMSSYSFSTAPPSTYSKSDKYINVTGHINIYNKNVTRQNRHGRRPVSQFERETPNKSSLEDESDECYCAEVGHPEMNYFEMDMRQKNGRKKSTGAMTGGNNEKEMANQENKSPTHTFRASLNIFRTESNNSPLWRRRSLTPDSAELMQIQNFRRRWSTNHHSVLYADLVIHDNNMSQLDPIFQNHRQSKCTKAPTSDVNYLTIDVRKTEILAEVDKGITGDRQHALSDTKDDCPSSYFNSSSFQNSDSGSRKGNRTAKQKKRSSIIDKLFNNICKKFPKNK